MAKHIELYGCREGNLKGIDVKIPYNQLTVVTGVSGSGKSSLAFKTIFVEGRRRIIESLDPRESFFISNTCAPKIDLALGLSPAIAIQQIQHIRNPKSTLGSISHINPFIYLLYATCGDIPCEECTESADVFRNPPFANKCGRCGHRVVGMQPGAFSTLSPVGMCQECGGTGVVQAVDETLLYPNQNLSISQGGLVYGGPKKGTMKYKFFQNLLGQYSFDIDTPIRHLSNEAKVALLYGVARSRKYKTAFPGLVPTIMKTLKETRSEQVRSELQPFVVESTCTECDGHGIGRLASSVTLRETRIHDILSMDLVSLVAKLHGLSFNDVRDEIATIALGKAIETAKTMIDLGIGYLSLRRQTASLSGGEMHRARMAAQLASQLSGVIYVLDEPSSGLHSEEVGRLLSVMHRLRDLGSGNTVLIVEHDSEIIRHADFVIELGPGPSKRGGNLVCAGSPEQILSMPESITAKLLSSCSGAVSRSRRPIPLDHIGIRHACSNNLKDVCIDIPLHCIVAVTGISGSGKSSLVFDSLCTHGGSRLKTRERVRCQLVNRECVDKIILSNQAPISRSSRSVVATYLGIFSPIREMFAKTGQARKLKLSQGFFSFNKTQGCCQTCGGHGSIEPDYPMFGGAEFTCPECNGKRFSDKVLSVCHEGKSIGDVLDMDVSEARSFFDEFPVISRKLQTLEKVGLGYLTLGQSSVDLSGGEAQRLKLAVDLTSGRRKNALYVFDEPTAGLHANDVHILTRVFDRLLASGNSIIVVEHNLHLIWASDYIVEMGPGAGAEGGQVVICGAPPEIARTDTATGRALNRFLSI